MKMKEFIKKYTGVIDLFILNTIDNPVFRVIDNDEREFFVNNNEELYAFALRKGVDPDEGD